MNVLFIVYHGFSDNSGISKKIMYQVKGLEHNGHTVFLLSYPVNEEGHHLCVINGDIVADYGKGKKGAVIKRISYMDIYKYAVELSIDFVYARSFHNANPITIALFKRLKRANIASVIEIPTYPYDQEYVGFSRLNRMGLKIDQLFRKRLAANTNAIVTFSDEERIFGQKTIHISNGVDFDRLPLRTPKVRTSGIEIHLLAVAEVHYWHGYDRLIEGLGLYYQKQQNKKVYFHLVGGIGNSEMYGSMHAPGFKGLIEKYKLEDKVILHGQQAGDSLDKLFDEADFAIGSLGRHRTNIDKIRTLKNREYAARGIPFIYSETDEDFEDKLYVLKAPADETPIEIKQIIDFVENVKYFPEEIRKSISYLSWDMQINKVVDNIFNKVVNGEN